MKPVVITVCVQYWDFLRQTLPYTKDVAKHVFIMTTPDFEYSDDTIQPEDRVTVLMVDMYQDAAFNKAGAIRAAQNIVHTNYPDDWILLLDADIIVPGTFSETLDRQALYGAQRMDYFTPEDFHRQKGLPYPTAMAGYFQLYFDKTKMYKTHSIDASTCDMDFLSLFSTRVVLPLTVKHLGYPNVNWQGRVSDAWSV